MKNFENLGRELTKSEQRQINGGIENRMWCYVDGVGLIKVGTYSTFAECTNNFAANCVAPPYDYCYCIGESYYFAYCP